MDREIEEVERIPWAMLADDIEEPRRRWILQAAGMVVVAAIVGIIALQVTRRPTGTTVDLTPVDSAVAGEPVDPAVSAEGLAAAAPTSPAEPAPAGGPEAATQPHEAPLYSEADLMAVLPEQPSRYAAARAEWFVVDFFGAADGDAVPGLPIGLPLPEVGDGYSWVEWAKAIDSQPRPGGGFDVTVAFRTLTGSEDSGYRRMPVRAVVVPIALDSDGNASVADLPTPADLPEEAPGAAPVLETELPSGIAEAASHAAAPFGDGVAVVGGSAGAAEGWRVVVLVGDDSGVRWPLVVHVDP